jgi:hypothetical protein
MTNAGDFLEKSVRRLFLNLFNSNIYGAIHRVLDVQVGSRFSTNILHNLSIQTLSVKITSMSVQITHMSVKITHMIVQITSRVPASHARCKNHTCACSIAASQNPIRIFCNLTLILVGSC